MKVRYRKQSTYCAESQAIILWKSPGNPQPFDRRNFRGFPTGVTRRLGTLRAPRHEGPGAARARRAGRAAFAGVAIANRLFPLLLLSEREAGRTGAGRIRPRYVRPSGRLTRCGRSIVLADYARARSVNHIGKQSANAIKGACRAYDRTANRLALIRPQRNRGCNASALASRF